MPAHAKSTLSGVSITIPITDGRLNLGTWRGDQGVGPPVSYRKRPWTHRSEPRSLYVLVNDCQASLNHGLELC